MANVKITKDKAGYANGVTAPTKSPNFYRMAKDYITEREYYEFYQALGRDTDASRHFYTSTVVYGLTSALDTAERKLFEEVVKLATPHAQALAKITAAEYKERYQ
jgi:hypothetical protein